MSTLDQWLGAVCGELGLDPGSVDVRAVLDLTREVARGVDRPAAPLTAYLLGVAVGRGESAAGTLDRITGLARRWAQEHPPGSEPAG